MRLPLGKGQPTSWHRVPRSGEKTGSPSEPNGAASGSRQLWVVSPRGHRGQQRPRSNARLSRRHCQPANVGCAEHHRRTGWPKRDWLWGPTVQLLIGRRSHLTRRKVRPYRCAKRTSGTWEPPPALSAWSIAEQVARPHARGRRDGPRSQGPLPGPPRRRPGDARSKRAGGVTRGIRRLGPRWMD